MTDPETFLRERQTGIGGSDAPNLVGVGFRSAADVFREKTNPVIVRPPAGRLRRGLELEPLVAAMYRELMGINLIDPEGVVARHADRPWQLCHLDRRRPDGTLVQLKTTAGFSDDWGPPGTDQVPEAYRVQCLHEMGVTKTDSIDLIALDVIEWEPRIYRILFDANAWAWLTEIESRFWDHVQRREPPPSDWHSAMAPAPAALFAKGKAIELGADASRLIEQRKALAAIRDEADAEYRRITTRLEIQMGDAEIATAVGYRIKRINVAAGIVPAHERKAYTRLDVRAIRGS